MSLNGPREMTFVPGALTSMQEPQLLYEDLSHELPAVPPKAATVIADGIQAGFQLHASWLEFPAATDTVTPSFTKASIAALSEGEFQFAWILMLSTAGLAPNAKIHCSARTDHEE